MTKEETCRRVIACAQDVEGYHRIIDETDCNEEQKEYAFSFFNLLVEEFNDIRLQILEIAESSDVKIHTVS